MSTERRHITVNGMRVDIVRKPIKNLHLGVYPPNGRIRVAAPRAVSDDAVRIAVITRLPWIKRRQSSFKSQVRQSPREYVSGESHYFLGRRYRLSVVEHDKPARVVIKNARTLHFYVRRGSTLGQRHAFLGWYRRELKFAATTLVDKWAQIMKLAVPDWGIRA
jgi:predicted metal-dependent hydrolase